MLSQELNILNHIDSTDDCHRNNNIISPNLVYQLMMNNEWYIFLAEQFFMYIDIFYIVFTVCRINFPKVTAK